ncbi:MAG TPA: serine/threonine-protein kinase, partial [Woeseiaceae bacterium]|nr:serine/threonine-protein kinase [Woeseiaceae bacterium]
MRELTQGMRLADRYTLVRRLGGGGMSEVWLADDHRSDGRVALKFLAADLAGNRRRREQFHAEWRQASRLMHAHIVRTFEYHDDPDGPYFGMQYLDGPTFGELDGLPLDLRLRPFGLVADALRYAHGKGFVHRDVKADNILFDGRGAPYLVDFGVAARHGEAAAGGTPVTLSPQQRDGLPADAADDIYALGVLLHETLRGVPPAGGRVAAAGADGERLPERLVV